MRSTFRSLTLGLLLGLIALLGAAGTAAAQSPDTALPTAPAADRAGQGGYSEAKASLPGGPGKSPLEPYLITWLLPVAGLLSLGAAFAADRRVRGSASETGTRGGRTIVMTSRPKG